jgi:oxalate decarboxylase/phosphoglucose isomerase-like protein (cupin superfamily)
MKILKAPIFSLIVLSLLNSAAMTEENKKPGDSPSCNPAQSQGEVSKKMKLFLDQERKKLSKDFPYRMNLFKQGDVAKNKAGIRISEKPQQFKNLNLKGLLFYYKLFDHAMRVPHWHPNVIEAGVVLSGKMRVKIWNGEGNPTVFTVNPNETWLIPQATLHSLENVGSEELDFLVTYSASDAEDRDFVTAWASLPDVLLEKTLGLSSDEITALKKTTINRLSSYDPDATPEKEDVASPFVGSFVANKPLHESALGSIQRVDAKTTPAMQAIALQKTILKPEAMREPHWYTAGDVLFFVKKGHAFYTMMDSHGKVYKAILEPGDLVFIPVGTFHTYVNISGEPLEIYEAFSTSKDLGEISLLGGAQKFSPGVISSATGISKEAVSKIAKKAPQSYIIPF